jgi:hypothetical protein
MLHAPVSENETQDKQSKTQSEPESERRALGWTGSSALGLGGDNGSTARNERAQGWQPINLSTLSQGGILQRKCACGSLAGAAGTCEECQSKEGGMLQTKLSIGAPDDKYELEADRVADEVMRMPESKIQLQIDSPIIQTKSESDATVSNILSNQITSLQGDGRSMDGRTQSFMNSRFGKDFSGVRIHTDSKAVQLSRELNAQAFTVGNDIYFNSGKYSPENDSGKHLLAHELTHVVQQGNRIQTKIIQRKPETWYRGEGAGVKPSSLGGAIHDLGDGLYLTDDPVIALEYAQTRASSLVGSTPSVTSATVERSLLGKILDLTTDTRWKQYLSEGVSTHTNEGLIKLANENYWKIFQGFLEKYKLHLEDFDSIIGEEFVRGGKQICIRNPTIAASIRNILRPYVSQASNAPKSKNPNEAIAESEQKTVLEDLEGRGNTTNSSTVKVNSSVNVTNSVVKPDGSVVSEVEVQFSQGIESVNNAAPQGGAVPKSLKFRLTQNADGSFASAEPLAGEPPSLVEALGRQVVSEVANAGEGVGGVAGAAEGAVVTGATRAAKALPFVRSGLKWGGMALFIIVTGYQYVTATPQQRPRVLTKAAGGLAGGMGTGFVICNLLLDLETAGWGILFCGVLAGGAGGYAGSEVAGEVYDAANPPPGLTELEKALLNMEHQPNNVKSLFYSMIRESGTNGIALTPKFINQFVFTVPPDLAIDELYMLAGQLRNLSSNVTLQTIIDNLSHAIYQLPRRKPQPIVLPPMLNIRDVFELNPSLRFRLDAPKSGAIRILPGYANPIIGLPESNQPKIVPLLEITL